MPQIDISLTDGLVILAYVIGLVAAGLFMRQRKSAPDVTSSDELFLSGRSLPWYKVGLSIFSTNVSPSMLVAYFGAAYSTGMVLANFEWGKVHRTVMTRSRPLHCRLRKLNT
jgi:SSS family solute:Na+ symporter